MAAPIRKILLRFSSCCCQNASKIERREVSSNAVRPKKRRFLKFLGITLGTGVTTGIIVYYMAKKNYKQQTIEGKTTTNTVRSASGSRRYKVTLH